MTVAVGRRSGMCKNQRDKTGAVGFWKGQVAVCGGQICSVNGDHKEVRRRLIITEDECLPGIQ